MLPRQKKSFPFSDALEIKIVFVALKPASFLGHLILHTFN